MVARFRFGRSECTRTNNHKFYYQRVIGRSECSRYFDKFQKYIRCSKCRCIKGGPSPPDSRAPAASSASCGPLWKSCARQCFWVSSASRHRASISLTRFQPFRLQLWRSGSQQPQRGIAGPSSLNGVDALSRGQKKSGRGERQRHTHFSRYRAAAARRFSSLSSRTLGGTVESVARRRRIRAAVFSLTAWRFLGGMRNAGELRFGYEVRVTHF